MLNFFQSFNFTNNQDFPNTKSKSSSGGASTDGTHFTTSFVDDIWGFLQALLNAAGLTPSESVDVNGASQILDAIEIVAYNFVTNFIGSSDVANDTYMAGGTVTDILEDHDQQIGFNASDIGQNDTKINLIEDDIAAIEQDIINIESDINTIEDDDWVTRPRINGGAVGWSELDTLQQSYRREPDDYFFNPENTEVLGVAAETLALKFLGEAGNFNVMAPHLVTITYEAGGAGGEHVTKSPVKIVRDDSSSSGDLIFNCTFSDGLANDSIDIQGSLECVWFNSKYIPV